MRAVSSSSSSSSSCPYHSKLKKKKKKKNITNFLVVCMAKKKKGLPSSPSHVPEPAPPRITSNVKQSLQFLKMWKEYQKRNSGNPKPATSYRRKRQENEELPEDVDLYRDPTLSSLYYTNQGLEDAVPVLLVDGYNVCGYWPKLKKHFAIGRLDVARLKLIDELITFSMLREVKVVVVFDAMMSGLPTNKETFIGIEVVYSGETCADAWIEKENNYPLCLQIEAILTSLGSKDCDVSLIVFFVSSEVVKGTEPFLLHKQVVALRQDGCPRVWVVTSDVCQQRAAHGAGAFVWSCKVLVSEIKASKKEVQMMLQEQSPTSFRGKLLKDNLDAEVVEALKELRQKLSEGKSKNG